ncbi:MAG: hypothetical protein IPP72_16100 [Chitinophagaceae bacterium]|nr:hypothetical protein [Chitinophagaceae bacterium]
MISIYMWLYIGPGKMSAEQFHSNLYQRKKLGKTFSLSLLATLPLDILIVYLLMKV